MRLAMFLVFLLLPLRAFAFETIDVSRSWNGQKINLNPKLYLPSPLKDGEKVPVMVISHGSGGLRKEHQNLADEFVRMGIGAVIIDSFGPREIKSTIDNQARLKDFELLVDAVLTLQVLGKHSHVDASRIGYIGFSKTGTVATRADMQHYTRRLPYNTKFKLLIAAYPWCGDFPADFRANKSKLYVLLGEADTYTGTESCKLMFKKLKDNGADIHLKLYPDAEHAWDLKGSTHWEISNGQNFANCRFEERKNGWVETKSGINVVKEHERAVSRCMTMGVSGGYNAKAAQELLADVREYVTNSLLERK